MSSPNLSPKDDYHEFILAFYQQLSEANQVRVQAVMQETEFVLDKIKAIQATLKIPSLNVEQCQRCRHYILGHRCDIHGDLVEEAIYTCRLAGWYESGVITIGGMDNSVSDGNGHRHTKSTGEQADEKVGRL